jgi:hypothetical protein
MRDRELSSGRQRRHDVRDGASDRRALGGETNARDGDAEDDRRQHEHGHQLRHARADA